MHARDVVRPIGTNDDLDASAPTRRARPTGPGPTAVGPTDDRLERGADRVAAAVVGALQRQPAAGPAPSPGRVRAASHGPLSPHQAPPVDSTGVAAGTAGAGRVHRATGTVQREIDGVDTFLEEQRAARATAPAKRVPGRIDAMLGKHVAGAALEQHLVATGRANQLGDRTRPRRGKLGGARSTEADEKVEQHAGKILAGLENSTRDNQLATNPDAVTTHAVSGHGPGTDQESRLLHGRRNDQLVAERKANGGRDPDAPATVGDDPSNTSGAFTTARGMLHAVTEGFAQANMFSGHADTTARERGPEASRLDDARFVTNVTGPSDHDELGYNLEVTGYHSQQKGAALARGEVDARRAAITRTGGLTRARVVLDPAYVGGKRAGWNLQTAYANADAPTAPLTQPADAKATTMALDADVSARERDVASAKARLERADADKQRHLGAIEQKRLNVERLESLVRDGPVPPPDRSIEELGAQLAELQRQLDELDDDGAGFSMFGDEDAAPVDEAEEQRKQEQRDALGVEIARLKPVHDAAIARQRLTEGRAELAELELATPDKDAVVDAARDGVAAAEAIAAQAARALAEHRAAERARRPGGNAGRPPGSEGKGVAGYDPATGTYTGDRPSKLGSQLRGTDEEGDALTAHHLYPWNKIRDDLNRALASSDRAALETLFAFGDVEVADGFWDELRKPAAERTYAFSEEVNAAAQKICWSPRNIFMGPLSSKRGDDPGEELDAAFTKSGLPTTASAAAELIDATGGIVGGTPDSIERDIDARYRAAKGIPPTAPLDEAASTELAAKVALAQGKRRLAELVLQRTREAQGSQTRAYDPGEWATDDEGKRVRAGRVPSARHSRSVATTDTAELDAFLRRLRAVAEATSARVREEADAVATALRDEAVAHLRKGPGSL